MAKLSVRGVVDKDREVADVDLGRFADAFEGRPTYQAAFQFEPADRSQLVETHHREADINDVVEVRYSDGSTRWMSLGRLNADFGQTHRGDDELVIAADSFPESTARGAIKTAVQGVGLLGLDLPNLAGKQLAKWLGDKIEGRIGVEEGLYLAPSKGSPEIGPATQPNDVSTTEPNLIFIHGTGSYCVGGFGTLWLPTKSEREGGKNSSTAWRDDRIRRWDSLVKDIYGQRAFAFEHRTLTQSPIANAINLLKALPKDARLHLISHSRGGLVGELIARSNFADAGRGRKEPITEEEIKAYGKDGKAGRHDQQAELEQLNGLLIEKQPVVEKFVRVACPTSGTTLADGKLDDWLSGFASLIEKLAPIGENDMYYLMKAITLAVVKQKADASVLPGLEAMMSSSALVRLINTGPEVDADLSAISGDTDSGWIPWMWPVDRFFRTEEFPEGRNDLVVPTRSMNTGHRRTEGQSRTFEDRGTSVNHFNYFSNRKTFERLAAGLRRQDGDAGFTPLHRGGESRESESARGFWTREPRPRVILLPGISGSHLQRNRDRIWMQYHEIILGSLTQLDVKNNVEISSDGIIRKYYRSLSRFLGATHKVEEFHYDWRRTLRQSADDLDKVVLKALEDEQHAGQPIRILAHSMGGLVARVWVAQHSETWKRVCSHPDSRFIMLGTPNAGSFSIPYLLLGRDSMIKMLEKWDWYNTKFDLLSTFVRFPGMLTLLPQDQGEAEGSFHYLQSETWTNLQANDTQGSWPLPAEEDLQAIKADWELLNSTKSIDAERMIYVAGTAPETASGITIGPDGVSFDATSQGDGRVTWDNGIPKSLSEKNKVWYMPCVHGDMCRHQPSFTAIQDLLQSGSTSRLPRQPVARRGLEMDFVLPERSVRLFPDEEMLLAAAMGASDIREAPRGAGDDADPLVRIGITHGDLHHETARPIVVGHYVDDAIVNAEHALDEKLHGKLSELRDLGVYPDRIGSSEIVLEDNTGGIVVGLGVVGQLTPGTLKQTLRDGLIRYVHRITERDRSQYKLSEAAHLAIPVTSLLVGSGSGGLSQEECITCLLDAVQEANRVLRGCEMAASITDVQLIELFEDAAISAAKALQMLSDDPAWRNKVTFECPVQSGVGGRKRTVFVEPAGWARRVQIVARPNGSLVYSTPTDRARVDVNVQPTQRRLINRFVKDASQLTRRDRGLEKTLFQLLVPNRLKEQLLQRTNTVLMLDRETARYPWELLDDRRDEADFENTQPRSVQYNLIRQLSTSDYRERPKSTTHDSVLVIGDPPSSFPELVGAQQEAQTVADRFRDSGVPFAVTSLIREEASPMDSIQGLFAGGYRVVHLAGHGVYDYEPDETSQSSCGKSSAVTGMVLGEGIFLTAVEVEQMTEVPELVFINCCLLGRIEPDTREKNRSLFADRGATAANLATQFIKMGARCVVAAGWEVEDGAAQTFAREFYDALFAGRKFADAVRQARRAAYDDHPSTNTWGAYQCYGDPEYRLVRDGRSSQSAIDSDYVSSREPETEVSNIAAAASKETDAERRRQLLQWLDAVHAKVIKEDQGQSPQLLCAFANAFSQLDEFTRAIEHYTAAIESEKSSVTFKAIEQRANLRARMASTKVPASSSPAARNQAKEAVEKIRESILEVKRLNKFSKTAERYSLIGSAHKRSAMVLNKVGEDCDADLKLSKKAYLRAAKRDENDSYPLLNVIGIEIAECWQRKQKLDTPELTDALKKARSQLAARLPSNFWERTYYVDLFLYDCLAKNELATKTEEVIGHYEELRRYGSAREFASVTDQIRFLIFFAPDDVKQSLQQILYVLQADLEE